MTNKMNDASYQSHRQEASSRVFPIPVKSAGKFDIWTTNRVRVTHQQIDTVLLVIDVGSYTQLGPAEH